MKELVKNHSKQIIVKRISAYVIDVASITMLLGFLSYYLINSKLGTEVLLYEELSRADRIFYDIIALGSVFLLMVAVPIITHGRTLGKILMGLCLFEESSGHEVPIGKLIVRQLIFLFLLGGFLNPCYRYLFDFIAGHTMDSVYYAVTFGNAFSVFCICGFLFTRSHRTYYDRLLNIQVGS